MPTTKTSDDRDGTGGGVQAASRTDGPAKLKDVALLAGVNVGTASRALSGRRKVSPEIVERVKSAVATLGYAPNYTARNLRLARSMTFGLIVGSGDPIYLEIIEGVGAVAQEHEYAVMVTIARNDPAYYRLSLQRLIERRLDGIFLAAPFGVAALLAGLGPSARVLSLLARDPDASGGPLVVANEEDALRSWVERLVELGHRQILYLASPYSIRRGRRLILQEAATQHGAKLVTLDTAAGETTGRLSSKLRDALYAGGGATAVISDYHNRGILRGALGELGLRAPRDLSIIVVARSAAQSEEEALGLATIQTDVVEFGRRAAELMLRWVQQDERPPETFDIKLTTRIERASVGPAPGRA